jgi:type I restriction enzyme R subunit
MSVGASGGGGRAHGAGASPNFGFLAGSDPALAEAAARAERYGFEDPRSALMQLRLFGERMGRAVGAEVGLSFTPETPQLEVLGGLRRARCVEEDIAELFHDLRRLGNNAAHDRPVTQREALQALRAARHLAVWFYRTFRDPGARLGLFVTPPNPAHAESALAAELERVREALAQQEAELRGGAGQRGGRGGAEGAGRGGGAQGV